MIGFARLKVKMQENRYGTSALFAIVWTLVWLSFYGGRCDAADTSFTTRMDRINRHLDLALNRVLNVTVDYTPFNENATYKSSTRFNPRGMAGLYNLTNIFMDLVVKDAYPRGFLTAEDGHIEMQSFQNNWDTLLKHYSGLLAVLIVFLIFGILMPIVGFFFCCCRCCGNCGARSQPFDKKHDSCRKVILASLLICVGTGLLFGVVCAFVSNQHLQDGTNELTTNLHRGVDDSVTYLEHTNRHIDTLLITNYGELEETLLNILNDSGNIVFQQLGEYSQAVALTTLTAVVNGLPDVQMNLKTLTTLTNNLRVSASQLNDGLRKVKRDLLQALNNCANCGVDLDSGVKDDVSKMNTQIDFDSLPDVTTELAELEDFIENKHIAESVNKGQKAFEKIKESMTDAVKDAIPRVQSAIEDAGRAIRGGANNLTTVLQSTTQMIRNHTSKPLDQMDKYLVDYSPYRYYAGLGVSVILLLVALCVSFGLICGVCGKRPDGYGDDCCNKGAGSRFLMIGVCIMFLFAIVLVVITLALFATGVVSQRLVCDPIRDPADNQLLELADGFLNLKNRIGIDVNVSDILENCYQNKSIYKVLHLETKMNMSVVENYVDEYNISAEIDKLQSLLNVSVNVTILEDSTKQTLEELARSDLAKTPWSIFIDVLQDNITSIDLNLLADKLENISNAINPKTKQNDLKRLQNVLRNSALHLRVYQTKLVNPMMSNGMEMKTIAKKLDEGLKFNETDFEAAINKLIKEVEDAQKYLQENGTNTLTVILVNFTQANEKLVRDYLKLVTTSVEENVGECGPISLILNATLTATCDKILLPWNGFWFGVGWCLVLFIPIIILSVKLATLYQKSDPYPGPLVESEYLYDAYADRDNIPLANHGKKKKKQKRNAHDNRGGYMAGSNGPERMTPRDIASGSAHPEARYADMAPKHWEEFPAGGPPQYQPGAPPATEYERPPPYYYPGPGEQQH